MAPENQTTPDRVNKKKLGRGRKAIEEKKPWRGKTRGREGWIPVAFSWVMVTSNAWGLSWNLYTLGKE